MFTQTEGTNLAVVEESSLGAKNPPTFDWHNVAPNSYGTFGPSYKTTPRNPISKDQQLNKGMLTDEDSGIPFEADVTKDVIDRYAHGIYRSKAKHAGNTGRSKWYPSAVASGHYVVDALGGLTQRLLVKGRNFRVDANNGVKMVTAGATGTQIPAAGLADEPSPPTNATLEVVGWRGATGDIKLDADGNLTSTLADFTAMGLNEQEWIVIGGDDSGNRFATAEFFGSALIDKLEAHKLTLKYREWVPNAHASLDLGTLATQLDTVVEAKASGAGGNAITVASVADGTPAAKASLDMDAAGNSAHIDTIVQAKFGGTAGNAITVEVTTGAPTAAGVLTEIGTHVKLAIKTATTVADLETLIGTSTLIEVKTPGTGATVLDNTDAFDSVPLTGGTAATAANVTEAGSAVTLHYTSGATTVAELEAKITALSTQIQVKTPGTQSAVLLVGDDDFGATNLAGGNSGADDGAGKDIDIWFSRWYRNVSSTHPDYLPLPSFAFEMTYQTLGDDGSPRYEYMLGNMIDEWVWNIPLTSKATVNASFVGTHTQPITDVRKDGPADARDPETQAGVSTATNLVRLFIQDADENGIATDFQSLKISVKNNVSPQKQLASLPARIMNVGQHTEMMEASVIFTTPEVINAIRKRTESNLGVLMRNEDFGALIHMQALTFDSGDRKLERNKAVVIDSKGSGYKQQLTGSTGSLTVFGHLPAWPDPDA